MEMLILAAVAAVFVKNVALDVSHMATGRTPPSHAYRMAKLREKAAKERRRLAADPDMRGGLKMVLRHCYLDACEELDAWRAGRHASRPERRAAARERRADREKFTARWGWRREDPMPDDADEVIDAEIVDEDEGTTPPPASGGSGGARSGRSSRRTTTTTTTVTEEETTTRPAGSEVAVVNPDEEAVKAPLPHRRMVLMTMLATAGYAPDTDAIARMTSEEVDGAIAALVAHERATREATHH
ncbi:hypothetical protein ACWGKS_27095 [Nocardiopsis sp. NPDC055879]